MSRRFRFSLWSLLYATALLAILIVIFGADPLDNRTRVAVMLCCLLLMVADWTINGKPWT